MPSDRSAAREFGLHSIPPLLDADDRGTWRAPAECVGGKWWPPDALYPFFLLFSGSGTRREDSMRFLAMATPPADDNAVQGAANYWPQR